MAGRKLNAKELADDVRRGLSDNELMGKYELSPSQLERALGKLLEMGLITEANMSERSVQKGLRETTPLSGQPAAESGMGRSSGTSVKTCQRCDIPLTGEESECPRCGVVLPKSDHPAPSRSSAKSETAMPDPNTQPATFQEKVAGYFYAEAGEVREKKRKQKMLIIYTAIALVVISLFFAAIGYGEKVVLLYALGLTVFMFLYYIVVLYHCFKQSILWGICSLCFSPAAILFVILYWGSIFQGKLLPKLWLALMVPWTVFSIATYYLR